MKDKILRFFFGYDNPSNLYEQCPFLAWVFIFVFIFYALWGFFLVFNIKFNG